VPWRIEFYEEEDESRPVEEFLETLPAEHRAKVAQCLQLLEEFGPILDDPYSSQIKGKLRELKSHYGKAQYRILYYGDPIRSFVLLHGLRKVTGRLPEGDIEIAEKRMARDLRLKGRSKR
jgi:phage-related protein